MAIGAIGQCARARASGRCSRRGRCRASASAPSGRPGSPTCRRCCPAPAARPDPVRLDGGGGPGDDDRADVRRAARDALLRPARRSWSAASRPSCLLALLDRSARRGACRAGPRRRCCSPPRGCRGDHLAVAGFAFMALAGYVANTIHLLVPLDLRDDGAGEAAIGLGLTVGAAVFLCTSILLARIGPRAARVGLGAIAAGRARRAVRDPDRVDAGGAAVRAARRARPAAGDAVLDRGAAGSPRRRPRRRRPRRRARDRERDLGGGGDRRPGRGRPAHDHVGAAAPWVLNIALCAAVAGWTIRTRIARSPPLAG